MSSSKFKSKEHTHPQFFHQKGWIATNFKVKNSINTALMWRKRNFTQQHKDEMTLKTSTFLNKSTSFQPYQKPATAPGNDRKRQDFADSFQQVGPVSTQWDDTQVGLTQTRYSNFKTTLGNRKQLLFIKPYMRYRNQSLTIDQKKTEIYKEINNPDLTNFNESFRDVGMIEYMTEYKEPYTARTHRDQIKPKINHRRSMNVLKEKLKKCCLPTPYQKKIIAVKFE